MLIKARLCFDNSSDSNSETSSNDLSARSVRLLIFLGLYLPLLYAPNIFSISHNISHYIQFCINLENVQNCLKKGGIPPIRGIPSSKLHIEDVSFSKLLLLTEKKSSFALNSRNYNERIWFRHSKMYIIEWKQGG